MNGRLKSQLWVTLRQRSGRRVAGRRGRAKSCGHVFADGGATRR